MELFRVALRCTEEATIWKLSRYLSEAYAEWDGPGSAPELRWEIEPGDGTIRCTADRTACQPEQRAAVLRHAAAGLSAYIVDHWEEALLEGLIAKESGYEDEEERRRIAVLSRRLLEGTLHAEAPDPQAARRERELRIRRVKDELQPFLQRQRRIDLDGFVRFRLSAYRAALREVMQQAVDEWILDKQYHEFLELLRYFVSTQIAKTSVVHVLQEADGQFRLCNYELRPLDPPSASEAPASDLPGGQEHFELDVEDRIVSSLITVSPRQIVIHTERPEQQVIRTIRAIFGERVTVCGSCQTCRMAAHRRDPRRDPVPT
ncbi:putative sporulation protein YtxC [Paenibacillus sp. IB182496]|uniref:Sporulation protein YtxC n=1 Tax=Paenibacillus sabuli TaxID=2772509 RepID=A0A927BU17_9BACL|nr:putative sporulation protein YtxC [Paenibacillus sabuli]MBD2845750.1 putative sporulation protein YtxC [Paenibacillus sabuli]